MVTPPPVGGVGWKRLSSTRANNASYLVLNPGITSPFSCLNSIILFSDRHIWYLCVGLHRVFPKMSLLCKSKDSKRVCIVKNTKYCNYSTSELNTIVLHLLDNFVHIYLLLKVSCHNSFNINVSRPKWTPYSSQLWTYC